MPFETVSFSLTPAAGQRDLIRDYLDELPVLDRKVLYHWHREKREPARIASDLDISVRHVERIVSRALTFATDCRTLPRPVLSPYPVRTESSLGVR